MTEPRIFYYCFDHQHATGGQRTMYRHVDILNDRGYEAYVFHRKSGFSIQWFQHQTRVINEDEFRRLHDPARDILVVPEDLGHEINRMPGPKVIFNQNCYHGFSAFDFQKPAPYPYLRTDVRGVMTVSEHNRQYLAFAFPRLRIQRIYFSVDPHIFVRAEFDKKKRQIACVPMKDTMDLLQLYHLVHSRMDQGLNRLNEYEWVFIRNKPERQVARILRDSLIFVFLSTIEGLPRMVLEAMRCGCIVLGYDHGPLTEVLSPDNSCTPERLSVVSMAGTLEAVAARLADDPEGLRSISNAAYHTACEYSIEREEESVLEFWEDVIQAARTPKDAVVSQGEIPR